MAKKLKVFTWPSHTAPPGTKTTRPVHCVALAPSKRSIAREKGDEWRVAETENEEDVRIAHENPGRICMRVEHGSREDRGRWWFADPKQPFTDPFPKKEKAVEVTIYACGPERYEDDGTKIKVYEAKARRGASDYMLAKYMGGPHGFSKRIPRHRVDETRANAIARFIRDTERELKSAERRVERLRKQLANAGKLK